MIACFYRDAIVRRATILLFHRDALLLLRNDISFLPRCPSFEATRYFRFHRDAFF
jgi:hypothetical protein